MRMFLFLSLALIAVPSAFAQTKLSAAFTGAPGKTVIARIDGSSEDPRLVITENGKVVIENWNINFENVESDVEGPELSKAPNGSLLISAGHYQSRSKYERTLTVSYRGGQYVVTGFTYSYWDAFDPKQSGSCDYNLLTRAGKRNGKPVRIKTGPIELSQFDDRGEKYYECSGF